MVTSARYITVLISVLVIFLSTQGGLVVHSLFFLRQEHIAQHHCENRFRPESKCKGKCFLKKRIMEADQKEKDQRATVVSSAVFYYLVPASSCGLMEPEFARFDYVGRDESCELPGHNREIDPPPRLT